ncbi:MAG: GntR family transcriptional regulator [Rhizobiaceae bacterium]
MSRIAVFPDAPEADGGQSRSVRALLAIRELILDGTLAAGKRVSELSVAERTGLSRTPIRAALQRLSEEGLVETIPSGGFVVKSFSQQDVFDSIEVRGVLEGLAARLAAERGSTNRLGQLQACLSELDEIVETAIATEDGFSSYVAANARLHALVIEMAESPTLKRQIDRAVSLPFASPSGFVMAQSVMSESHRILLVAQDQHRCIVEAIAGREGARAQALMQEHARLAARNLRLALSHEKALERVPGGMLIRTVR